MAVTTIDGVKTLQIRKARNGDFDLNFATGGGGGGDSKPFYPIVEKTITYDENFNPISTETQITQGMCINCIAFKAKHTQPSSGQGVEESYLLGVVQIFDDNETKRYFSRVGEEGAFAEIKVNEAGEITEIVNGEYEIQVVCTTSTTIEVNKVYTIEINKKLLENGSSTNLRRVYFLSPYNMLEPSSLQGFQHKFEFSYASSIGYIAAVSSPTNVSSEQLNVGDILATVI